MLCTSCNRVFYCLFIISGLADPSNNQESANSPTAAAGEQVLQDTTEGPNHGNESGKEEHSKVENSDFSERYKNQI